MSTTQRFLSRHVLDLKVWFRSLLKRRYGLGLVPNPAFTYHKNTTPDEISGNGWCLLLNPPYPLFNGMWRIKFFVNKSSFLDFGFQVWWFGHLADQPFFDSLLITLNSFNADQSDQFRAGVACIDPKGDQPLFCIKRVGRSVWSGACFLRHF